MYSWITFIPLMFVGCTFPCPSIFYKTGLSYYEIHHLVELDIRLSKRLQPMAMRHGQELAANRLKHKVKKTLPPTQFFHLRIYCWKTTYPSPGLWETGMQALKLWPWHNENLASSPILALRIYEWRGSDLPPAS